MKKDFCVKGLFASGMVLQRNKINCIYGTADIYADIIMAFRGLTTITQADENGDWKIEFSPGEAGGPFELSIKCDDNEVLYKDVYVGEVWVHSGQSNSQLPMERMKFSYPEEFTLPENQNIRILTIPITWSFHGEKDTIENPQWISVSPATIGQMSGNSYFFAKRLYEELNVPIGIINTSQGGSPITSWLSKQSLEEMGDKRDYLRELAEFEDDAALDAKRTEVNAKKDKWYHDLNEGSKAPDFETDDGWNSVLIPGDIQVTSAGFYWFKKEIVLSAEQIQKFNTQKTWIWMGTIVDADTIFVNGTQVGSTGYCYPPRRYVVPEGTLHEGKNLITMRIQLNNKHGKIRFYEEKPYFIFTENVRVNPVAVRNVEVKKEDLIPIDGECINLSGEWKMKTGVEMPDAPGELFLEWAPTALYNSMLAPCFKHAVSGVVWYQGESNAGKWNEYKGLLVKLISSWRKKFVYGAKNLPFVIMQLPNWSDGHGESSVCMDSEWAHLRQTQSDAVEMCENTGLAVLIDGGEWNDLHPEKKKTSGTRAALEALRLAYGKSYIQPSPKVEYCDIKKHKIVVHFDCGSSALMAGVVDGNACDFSMEAKDKIVYGFSLLCEKKGVQSIVQAVAKIKADNIVEVYIPMRSGQVKEIRYLWADSPAPVNLYSREGLPARPFKFNC